MKKLIIGLLTFYSVSLWADTVETPTSPVAQNVEVRLTDVETVLSDLQAQFDMYNQNFESIKQRFDVFELVKANNQVKIQNAELQKHYAEQTKQSDVLSQQLSQQQALVDSVNSAVSELKASLAGADEALNTLNQQIAEGESTVAMLNKELSSQLQETNTTTQAMVNQFTLVAIGFGIAVLLIGGFIFILRRKIDASGVDMEQKIHSAKASLEENALSLDLKLVEVLEKQMQLSQEQKVITVTEQQDVEPDHSLSLKVADEITRMQKNISQMDQGVKGLKPLTKGLERIRKNFMANGYEIVDLLNKPFDDRMNIDVINMIDDPSLGNNEKIIVKVSRPQVNFNGALIQRAQVDIAVN
ncbi:hypothetical protein [Endozoicomonas ascidiicola]|uniref:hypothetical protein n=1 Tax=Endozoicomonas ascidiicola TaxID=1698521 RepID=UPI0008375FE0|nr:hypothetical protein [Endozoicomonas ascidiicola]